MAWAGEARLAPAATHPGPVPAGAGLSGENLAAPKGKKFVRQFRLGRARPGHPRLEAATTAAPKTWMAGPSPATGILSGCTGSWPRNRLPIPRTDLRGYGGYGGGRD